MLNRGGVFPFLVVMVVITPLTLAVLRWEDHYVWYLAPFGVVATLYVGYRVWRRFAGEPPEG